MPRLANTSLPNAGLDLITDKHEIVHVKFVGTPNTDTDVRHNLAPNNPENLDYEVVRASQPLTIYHDASYTRKPWQTGLIYLRCNIPDAEADIRLSIRDTNDYNFWASNVSCDIPSEVIEWGGGTVPWASVDKTGSSLGDLAARAIANLSDEANVARRNTANTFNGDQTIASGYDLNVDANTLVVDASGNTVGIMDPTPWSALTIRQGISETGRALSIEYTGNLNALTMGVNRANYEPWLGFNAYQGDSNNQYYKTASGAGKIMGSGSGIQFYGAGSGTQDALINWADSVVVAADGDLDPATNYDINLGSLSKKYLTLHAAELWVETLVAQETIATIGGRVLVGPTSTLVVDCLAADDHIHSKYNNLSNGDRIYLESNGKVEFMGVTSTASGTTGNWIYSVDRNLDLSGANDWYAGDAIFNTGTTGDGFIDLYSIRGVKSASEAGPTIVGNIRLGTTYNDWAPAWAIGNLNGLYDYGADTYGVAFGRYANRWMGIDPTNGIRMKSGSTTRMSLDATDLKFYSGSDATTYMNLGATALTMLAGGHQLMSLTSSGLALYSPDDKLRASFASNYLALYADDVNTYLIATTSGLSGVSNSATKFSLATDGSLTLWGGSGVNPSLVLDGTNGLRMKDSNGNVRVKLGAADAVLRLHGTDGGNPQIALDSANGIRITNSSGTVVTQFDLSGNATFTGNITATGGSFSGVLSVGDSGGIYQGTGSFGTPTTGLKIWSELSGSDHIGRIAGYASGVLQWGAETTGLLTAGAGKVKLSADGIRIVPNNTDMNFDTLLQWPTLRGPYDTGLMGIGAFDRVDSTYYKGIRIIAEELPSTAVNGTGAIYLTAKGQTLSPTTAKSVSIYMIGGYAGQLIELGDQAGWWVTFDATKAALTSSYPIEWGGDTNIYRSAANQLKTDDDFYCNSVNPTNSLAWSKVSKTSSSLADLATRSHSELSDGSSIVMNNTNIIPDADNSYSLGDGTHRFSVVRAMDYYCGSTQGHSGNLVIGTDTLHVQGGLVTGMN